MHLFEEEKRIMPDLLLARANELKNKTVYTFLDGSLAITDQRSYAGLNDRARFIGAAIGCYAKKGDRALLLYPAGLDYIDAFWGCLSAGVIAVTAYPPSYTERNTRLEVITRDCTPQIILCSGELYANRAKITLTVPALRDIPWLCTGELSTDPLPGAALTHPNIGKDDVAFLQYTSGSTAEPRGVMVTHENLLANEAFIREAFGHAEDTTGVGWLPLYHDMGLIGNILQPVYSGFTCHLMSSFTFIKNPFVWLKAISCFKAHTSGGPNFAYDLVTRTVKPGQIADLDLSSWKVAFNGAEPVRAATMHAFAEKFKPAGFQAKAFYPCYGLAEATLLVTGSCHNKGYRQLIVDSNDFTQLKITPAQQGTTLVAGGVIRPGHAEVFIVDPETKEEKAQGEIGEIWVQGKSVAAGYWNNPQKSAAVFRGFTAKTGSGPCLCTGDMGFLHEETLFVTGRIKELIIIRGRNYYPQDIEQLVVPMHPGFKPGCCAAFSVEAENEERLVVVQEIKNRADTGHLEAVLASIRQQLITEYGVDPYDILLVKSSAVPRTTSGKIQRLKCRELYLSNGFPVVKAMRNSDKKSEAGSAVCVQDDALPLEQWLLKELGRFTGMQAAEFKPDAPLSSYGFDSIKSMQLAHIIEEKYGKILTTELLSGNITIGHILDFLQESSPAPFSTADEGQYTDTGTVPLAPVQERIWFLYNLAQAKQLYNIAAAMDITGKLNEDAFKKTLLHIADRHMILKTCFTEKNGRIVHNPAGVLPVISGAIDLSALQKDAQEAALKKIQKEKAATEFNLETGPCWQATLVKLSESQHCLVLVVHHIIADGWSLNVFTGDLLTYYPIFARGETLPKEAPAAQYTDCILKRKPVSPETLEFWKARLIPAERLILPADFIRPPVQNFQGARYPITIPRECAKALAELARKEGVTLFTLLMTVYCVLLYRYTFQKHLQIGFPVANRDTRASTGVIGLFMDSLILAVPIEEMPFRELLQMVNRHLHTALQHRECTLGEIIAALNPPRDPSASPLFQVMFIFQNAIIHALQNGEIGLQTRQLDTGCSKFDLTLELSEHGHGIEGWFEYNCALFTERTIERMAAHLQTLLESAIAQPGENIASLPIHTPGQLQELIAGYNNTDTDCGAYLPVHKLFEEQAAGDPGRIALVFKETEVSYGALDAFANRIARYLLAQDPGKETLIGVCLPRSVEMVACVLGILKTGRAFVPLDPLFPAERIAYMIKDAGLKTIISHSTLQNSSMWNAGLRLICIDTIHAQLERAAGTAPLVPFKEDDLAYVIYTSGSTGKAKGVQIEQRSLVNFLRSMQKEPGLKKADKLLSVTTLAFDIANLELFLPLITGARLVLAAQEDVYDGHALSALIKKHGITVLQATPATWKLMIASGWQGGDLKALCGGEALSRSLAAQLLERVAELWNMYGPTETTIWSTIARIGDAAEISIGRPVANTSLFIVDAGNRLVPSGVPGELCIGGMGLARGYLHREELTTEKFITLQAGAASVRVYKTGDLVRCREKGMLEFIERIDNQVKLRGYRIEPGEIEYAIKSYPGIRDCAVSLKEVIKDEPALVGYLTGQGIDTGALKAHLQGLLPGYMVPGYFVLLEQLPLTPNGKLDKKALPLPVNHDRKPAVQTASRKTTQKEALIRSLWQEVLCREDLGTEDNFFDVGGHSLLLGKLHNRLQQTLQTKFELLELFRHTTIASQAAFFSDGEKQPNTQQVIKPASVPCRNEDIAVIGIGCRFPGAGNKEQFWANLAAGLESITRFSDAELLAAGVEPALLGQKQYVKAWGKLAAADMFDADFFGYTSREAAIIDPQQRVFLEEAYKALEDAGYAGQTGSFRIGLFAATGMNTYLDGFKEEAGMEKPATNYQYMIGNDKDFLATRAAYKLDLKGPAVSVQTACSSSLVAVHLACHCLQQGEADMVLAGGVSIRLPQDTGYMYQEGMILSPDGCCRAFDIEANGTVGGNGAGVVLLKGLHQAVRDNDRIYAVIKGSAMNNDGRDKIGYTAPGVSGQTAVIRQALAHSGLEPAAISFIENHGTGTQLGDPVEIAALKDVWAGSFNHNNGKKQYCALGSVKTNIGHLDCAAGIAGFIKAVLSLYNGTLPPSLHFTKPNPGLGLDDSPFYVNTGLQKWDEARGLMRCGVSSFGIGGTNAHVVLEQHSSRRSLNEDEEGKSRLFLLSAHNRAVLETMTENLGHYLESSPPAALNAVSTTLMFRRRVFKERLCYTAVSRQEAAALALNPSAAQKYTGTVKGKAPGIIFLFPGQGTQYVQMAAGLFRSLPVFRTYLEECARIIQAAAGFDILAVLYPAQAGAGTLDINETRITQPVLFAIEYSLAMCLVAMGLRPIAMLGHSLGEYVCACLAGVFSLEQALRLVVFRAELMQSQPPGCMLAVFETERRVAELTGAHAGCSLDIAAVNTPALCVVSGNHQAVENFKNVLARQKIHHREVVTSHAFHSYLMEGAGEAFGRYLAAVSFNKPQLPYISNVTGTWITDTEAGSPAYWLSHMRGKVRFSDGIKTLHSLGNHLYVEVGPGKILGGFVLQHDNKQQVFQTMPGHGKDTAENPSDDSFFLSTLGKLWCEGAEPDWSSISQSPGYPVSLPPYPFSRIRYWKENKGKKQVQAPSAPSGTRNPLRHWLYISAWKRAPLVPGQPGADSSRLLVFCDEFALGEKLAAALRSADNETVFVHQGKGFEKNAQNSYLLNPGQEADFTMLFAHLGEIGFFPDLVLYAWSISSDTDFLRLKQRCFAAPLFLVRALGALHKETTVIVLSAAAQSVTGTESLQPAKALLNGIVRTVNQEYPGVRCRSIDLLHEDCLQSGTLVPRLAEDIRQKNGALFCAYRGIYRLTLDFERYTPVYIPGQAVPPLPVKEGGVYLITGGTGGLGLLFARYLAAKPGAKLILLSRSALPAKENWDELIAKGDALGAKLHKIMELEALGSEVLLLQADVADEPLLGAALDKALSRFGAINGIIHAAGVPGKGLMQLSSTEDAMQVLKPKVEGTLLLDHYLANQPLDFFVLFSSITAYCGGIGQSAYASANAFLDAYALAHQNRRYPVIAVNWDTWNETGMAVPAAEAGWQHPPLLHPLIKGYRKESGSREQFYCRIKADDWIVNEHWILGKPTLPGTGYIEIVNAVLSARHPGQGVEFQNIYFQLPFTVEAGQEAGIILNLEQTAHGYNFTLQSSTANRPDNVQHAEGTAGLFAVEKQPALRLAEMEACCRENAIDNPEAIAHFARIAARGEEDGADKVTFGPRWQNIRWIKLGKDEGLALLQLPDAYGEDITQYRLHPALLDCAVAFLRLFKFQGLFLPFSYTHLKIYAPLPQSFYSHIRILDDSGTEEERKTINFAVKLLDNAGLVLAAIDCFTMREIDAGLFKKAAPRALINDTPAARLQNRMRADGIRNTEGLEVFELAMQSHLPQVIVSTHDFKHTLTQYTETKFMETAAAHSQDETQLHPRPELANAYVAPHTDLEKKIAALWGKLLGIRDLGVQDDVFELGVHSLLMVEFHKELKAVIDSDISIVELYKYKTTATLAARISAGSSEQDKTIRQVVERVELKKEAVQRRKSAALKRSMKL